MLNFKGQPDDVQEERADVFSKASDRRRFISRVYAILFVFLSITAGQVAVVLFV